jgi:hypothetical protein
MECVLSALPKAEHKLTLCTPTKYLNFLGLKPVHKMHVPKLAKPDLRKEVYFGRILSYCTLTNWLWLGISSSDFCAKNSSAQRLKIGFIFFLPKLRHELRSCATRTGNRACV